MILNTWALRCFGALGVLGAVLFICGDLLYNHVPGSQASAAAKMSTLPESRLLTAGTLGLIGCWCYTLGSLHTYLALRPVGEAYAFIFTLAFAAVMVCYGVSHTGYFAIAAGARTAMRNGSDAEAGGELGARFFQRLVAITYIPVAISMLMMLYGILSGRSLYPIWMVVFLPLFIYVLKKPVVSLLRGRLRELVNDCYDNLPLLVFFVASTAVLWNAVVQ